MGKILAVQIKKGIKASSAFLWMQVGFPLRVDPSLKGSQWGPGFSYKDTAGGNRDQYLKDS